MSGVEAHGSGYAAYATNCTKLPQLGHKTAQLFGNMSHSMARVRVSYLEQELALKNRQLQGIHHRHADAAERYLANLHNGVRGSRPGGIT